MHTDWGPVQFDEKGDAISSWFKLRIKTNNCNDSLKDAKIRL